MMAAALLVLAASTDTSAPHRTAIERLPLKSAPNDIAPCIARVLERRGRVTPITLADGLALDWAVNAPFAGGGAAPYVTVLLKSDQQGGFASFLYRRPLSAGAVAGLARDTAKTCFREDWNAWAAGAGFKAIP